MSDIPALAPDRILRFHAPDKVFTRSTPSRGSHCSLRACTSTF